jgi:uncharacterized protein YjdB
VSCGGDDDGGGTTGGGTVYVTGVTLNKTTLTLTLTVNVTEKLIATVAPDNATNKALTWSSSDTSIATVSADGTVSAVAQGTATITVKTADTGIGTTCAVTVTNPPEQLPTSGIITLNLNKFNLIDGLSAGDVKWYKFTASATTHCI